MDRLTALPDDLLLRVADGLAEPRDRAALAMCNRRTAGLARGLWGSFYGAPSLRLAMPSAAAAARVLGCWVGDAGEDTAEYARRVAADPRRRLHSADLHLDLSFDKQLDELVRPLTQRWQDLFRRRRLEDLPRMNDMMEMQKAARGNFAALFWPGDEKYGNSARDALVAVLAAAPQLRRLRLDAAIPRLGRLDLPPRLEALSVVAQEFADMELDLACLPPTLAEAEFVDVRFARGAPPMPALRRLRLRSCSVVFPYAAAPALESLDVGDARATRWSRPGPAECRALGGPGLSSLRSLRVVGMFGPYFADHYAAMTALTSLTLHVWSPDADAGIDTTAFRGLSRLRELAVEALPLPGCPVVPTLPDAPLRTLKLVLDTDDLPEGQTVRVGPGGDLDLRRFPLLESAVIGDGHNGRVQLLPGATAHNPALHFAFDQ